MIWMGTQTKLSGFLARTTIILVACCWGLELQATKLDERRLVELHTTYMGFEQSGQYLQM